MADQNIPEGPGDPNKQVQFPRRGLVTGLISAALGLAALLAPSAEAAKKGSKCVGGKNSKGKGSRYVRGR
jgi:hypothetical protein